MGTAYYTIKWHYKDGTASYPTRPRPITEVSEDDFEKGEWPVRGELVPWAQFLKEKAQTPEQRAQELFEFYLQDIPQVDRAANPFMSFLNKKGLSIHLLQIYLGAG